MRVRYRAIKPRPPAETVVAALPHARTGRSIVEWLEVIVAPATVLTGWFFWFGYCYANARARYFGLDPGALAFSSNDYILRSLTPLIQPAVSTLLIVIFLLAAHGFITNSVRNRNAGNALGICAVAALIIGAVSATAGVLSFYLPIPFLPPLLLLGGGTVLTAYSLSVLRALRHGERPVSIWTRWGQVAAAALLVVSLFWATTVHASVLGREQAESLANDISSLPSVTIFSKNSLAFSSAVEERVAPDDARADYHYRYTGLHLLARSGSKYLLLPNSWSRRDGPTIVMEDRPEIRIELGPSYTDEAL